MQEHVELEHNFDYYVEKSFYVGESMILQYKNYQGILSPWWSMIDEVRVLRICNSDPGSDSNSELEGTADASILLCMGSMAWSTRLNCQPFCLVKETAKLKST